MASIGDIAVSEDAEMRAVHLEPGLFSGDRVRRGEKQKEDGKHR